MAPSRCRVPHHWLYGAAPTAMVSGGDLMLKPSRGVCALLCTAAALLHVVTQTLFRSCRCLVSRSTPPNRWLGFGWAVRLCLALGVSVTPSSVSFSSVD